MWIWTEIQHLVLTVMSFCSRSTPPAILKPSPEPSPLLRTTRRVFLLVCKTHRETNKEHSNSAGLCICSETLPWFAEAGLICKLSLLVRTAVFPVYTDSQVKLTAPLNCREKAIESGHLMCFFHPHFTVMFGAKQLLWFTMTGLKSHLMDQPSCRPWVSRVLWAVSSVTSASLWLTLFKSAFIGVAQVGKLSVTGAIVDWVSESVLSALLHPPATSSLHSFSSSGMLRALSCRNLL